MAVPACLGLTIDAARGEVRLKRPIVPAGTDDFVLTGLIIGNARLDLHVRRDRAGTTTVRVVSPETRASVIVEA